MASNGYRQQWQQPPQQLNQYDQRTWQANEQAQRVHQSRNQYVNDYQGHPRGYDGYGHQGYEQPGQWQEQPYQGNSSYYNPPAQHERQDRNYQYDDRYRVNGDGRAPQTSGYGYDDGQRSKEKRRPPQISPEKKQKPRERILGEPTSPKTLAWDNPFGAFPPKKKGHEKHASLDKGLDRQGRQQRPEDRPQIPQDHRSRANSRPNTSQGHRPEPLQSPGIHNPAMAPRKDLPVSSRNAGNPTQPGMIGLPARPAPQRSATQPPPQTSSADHSFKQYGDVDPYGYDNQGDSVQALNQTPVQSRVPQGAMDRRPSEPTSSQAASRPSLDDSYKNGSYRGVPLTKPPSNNSAEVPNFEAMSTSTNEKSENLFPMTQTPQEQPVYSKRTYQALPPPLDIPKTKQLPLAKPATTAMGDGHINATTVNVAQIRYDNPPMSAPVRYDNPPNSAPTRYDNPPLSPTRTLEYADQRQYDPRLQSTRSQDNPPRQQTPNSQFPPRTASKIDAQPRPNTASGQRRAAPTQEYGSAHNGFDQTSAAGYANENGYDTGQQAQRREIVSYDMGNPYVHDRPSGKNYEQPHAHQPTPPHQSYSNPSTRPTTANSAHPIPVRHYGGRTSSDNQRGNPDALPAHPVPIRPGLIESGSRQGSQSSIPRREPTATVTALPNDGKEPPVTITELNNLREIYQNTPNDYPSCLKFAKKLVEAASVLASEHGRADAKQTARNRERYIFDAHKVVKKLVAAGYAEAMFYLADCHGQGLLGLAVDPKEAFQLYQSAAKLNHPQSAYRVAVCCELGNEEGGGTRRDPLKAIQWYKRAATLGDTPAMYKMGMILLKGLLGQPRNPREAVSWLKRASERADSDNPHALHELGLLYESATPTDHIVRDERYAFQLFSQSAELGYKYSQFRLGSAFEYGLIGCNIDPRLSIAWYTRAAAQGEHQSELALSGWYLTGSDPLLQQSDTEAYLWARKAASSGLAKAEYAMGYFTETGIGTPVNVEEAKRWYYRAAAQNFPKARERLEDLRKGGARMHKTKVSRSNVGKHNEGDCIVM